MGMFDSLFIECPHCKYENELQTKNGPCELEQYRIQDKLPSYILETFDGSVDKCHSCQAWFKVNFEYHLIVTNRNVAKLNGEPTDNEDF